ncbi:hypothetical protein AMR72_15225 [Flavobacterium psychrophilum]|nr:hypothetical protein AMR72_15225 [Flavobacterium psychrophilum]AOE54439.1 hypothetical protein ALW18_15215 [Flavobacterium psychrophilum]
MMKEPDSKPSRSHWLHLRLHAEEHEKLVRKWKASTYRKLSEYARQKLFDKPVAIIQRNTTLDMGLEALASVREELKAIGNNLNQLTRQINANPPDADSRHWQASFLSVRSELAVKLEDIHTLITQLSVSWLQS